MDFQDELPKPFDLFISYAHVDDRDANHRKVASIVDAIKADYLHVVGTPLEVFFDTEAIRDMDDWESRILLGLRQSRMMVAVLSPAYFQSEYCKKEWEYYVETELAHALPGEGIAPIYVVTYEPFDADPVEEKLRHWIGDLRRRQYIDWKEFWPHGAKALEQADVRARLQKLPGQIAERLKHAGIRERSPNTVPLPSKNFVGRRDEMHDLLKALMDSSIGLITAVNGIAGIGKSMLAFAYAWGYGFKYPGGRFLIPAADATDLTGGMIALAEPLGLAMSDAERQNPDVALREGQARPGIRPARAPGARQRRRPGRPRPASPGEGASERKPHPRPRHLPHLSRGPPVDPLPPARLPRTLRRRRPPPRLPPDRRQSPG